MNTSRFICIGHISIIYFQTVDCWNSDVFTNVYNLIHGKGCGGCSESFDCSRISRDHVVDGFVSCRLSRSGGPPPRARNGMQKKI